MIFDPTIGLSTGCFYDRPILDCLEAIRDAGFSILEICSSPTHLDYHDTPACEQVADRLRRLDLEPVSFHAPFAPDLDITSLDAAARRRACDEIFCAADAAAALGARFFVLHPGPETGEIPRSERLERMEHAAQALDQIAEHCRQLRLSLVLENMLPHLFAGPVRDLLWLLGALRSTDVGICLDTGHAYLSGDLGGVAHKLSGHLWMIHANDNRGEFDDHLPPGEGDIDWNELLRRLAGEGFHGTFILEIAGGRDTSEMLHGAQSARSYLRGLASEMALGTPGEHRRLGMTERRSDDPRTARARPHPALDS